MKENIDPELAIPFPVEIVIRDTPRSFQSPNAKAKEAWKRRVGEAAKEHLKAQRDFFLYDDRPLAATIFYFPPALMEGDVDNIVKLIIDGMNHSVYPNDQRLERIMVQKFEPGTQVEWGTPSLALEQAIELRPPVVYIRIDDDLAWRDLR